MKKRGHLYKLMFTVSIASMLFSCGEAKKETATLEPTLMTDTLVTMKAAPVPIFTPFDIVEISHTVKDYDKWRLFFNADSLNRKINGMEDIVVGRSIDKTNKVVIALKVSDVQKAKDFAASPALKTTMNKAGVNSKPDIRFFHVIRFNPHSTEKQWVLVTHKVKDFDAWLKSFDKEGLASRAEQGLIDVVLARDIDDSSMIHLVFDIKDIAKASILSGEKKGLLMTEGVEGTPVVEFYNTAE